MSTYLGPTADASCAAATLATAGPNCQSDDTVELADIEEIIFSETSTTIGVPKNPITGAVDSSNDFDVNEAVILTWIATAAQTGAGKLRRLTVIADKPAPDKTTVNLPKGTTYTIKRKHKIPFTRPLGDQVEHMNFWRKLEAGGVYHIWYTTAKSLYGGLNGIQAFVQGDIIFANGNPVSFIGEISWDHIYSPPRDKKPFPTAL